MKHIKLFEQFLNEKSDKNIFTKKQLDVHVLAFLVKYGVEYINNDASILEYLQNNDEDHADKESQAELKKALKDVLSHYESKLNECTWSIPDSVEKAEKIKKAFR